VVNRGQPRHTSKHGQKGTQQGLAGWILAELCFDLGNAIRPVGVLHRGKEAARQDILWITAKHLLRGIWQCVFV